MKVKDIKLGQPYAYERGRYWSYQVAYVLSTQIHVSKPLHSLYRNDPRYSLRGDTAIELGHDQKTGMLVVIFSAWDGLKDDAREVLGRLTYEDVATNGFDLPKWVTDVVPYAEVKLVHSRYLVGDYDEIMGVKEATERQAKEHRKQQEEEAALRVERWEAVVDAIAKLKGEERSTYYVSSYGEEPTKEIRLEDMEMLIGLARQVLPGILGRDEELPGMDLL